MNTDIEWLGRVPATWLVKPIKLVAEMIAGGTPDTENRDYWAEPESGTGWVAISDMSTTASVVSTTKTLTDAGIAAARLTPGEAGTVLFAMYASVGEVSQLAMRATWNQALLGLQPIEGVVSSQFLFYALKSAKAQLPFLYRSNTQNNLNAQQVSNIKLPIPSVAEQNQIVAYLGVQTAKIDMLIEKQERLVETLAERLDAGWSSAVSDLMRDFPSAPLRRVIESIVDGPFGSSLTSAHYSDGGASVVRLGNIGIDEFKMVDRAFVPLEYAQSLSAHAMRPGDIVVAGLGDERMPLGRAAIVPETFGTGIVKADCYRVRPGPRVTAEYISWVLSSPQSRTQFRALSRGSTRQRLNTQVVRDVVIPIPTLAVQTDAVAQAHGAREANSTLAAKAREMIDILKERRQALISAAVTGKIDVRGLV
ncbi:restriction endonuclease subunit S [Cryobacterium tagatosivorans]|uniref:Restriction endonuclease subunit S n=1 Tax=Cryobacterium tagatosivorans TaxID=1259199 RepID=A0A4R8UBS9_9MICO|nr:restriction endonuclease subunit S [Cryobacterium tagatosivorans]TFB47262.1 restriction endonuclease subunit S [Cryobacterium tagatosivorans]